jgi:type VI secretion system protein ImpK
MDHRILEEEMEAEPRLMAESGEGDPAAKLLDCYMELIAYTGYVNRQVKAKPFVFEEVAKIYENLAERSREAAVSKGLSEDEWREGLFPVCAFIDESLLCSDWTDSAQWEQNQLQRRYFNTTAAGWEFYDRLDNLKNAPAGIREIYEFCLALGFKGRYFRTSDAGRMEDIQYSQLKGVTGNTDLRYPATLFPDAYEPEAAEENRRKYKWKKYSLLLPVSVLLPALVFTMLYFWFDQLLDQMVAQYFGAGF